MRTKTIKIGVMSYENFKKYVIVDLLPFVGSTFLLIIQVGEIWMHNITIKVGKKLKDPVNQKRGLAIAP
jgi:hypothetical protein